MYSLRARFGVLAGVLLAAAVILQLLAIDNARSSLAGDGTLTQPSLAVPTVLTTLATFCAGVAVVLVAGIVALYVVDEVCGRRVGIAATVEGDDSDHGDDVGELSAYGSDPETL